MPQQQKYCQSQLAQQQLLLPPLLPAWTLPPPGPALQQLLRQLPQRQRPELPLAL